MWMVVLVVLVFAVAAALLAARRAHHEFEPTIRAFDDFRAALRPAIADLRQATVASRTRLAPLDRVETGRAAE